MGQPQKIFRLRHVLSAVVMLLALAWLTVSLPYVNAAQQHQHVLCTGNDASTDDSSPFSTTTEEKNESGTSLLSEYLHEIPVMERNFITLTAFFKCHPSDLYIAYHPELVLPPPDANHS